LVWHLKLCQTLSKVLICCATNDIFFEKKRVLNRHKLKKHVFIQKKRQSIS
jgi:hypothetical protein